jgi:hypothetical protein
VATRIVNVLKPWPPFRRTLRLDVHVAALPKARLMRLLVEPTVHLLADFASVERQLQGFGVRHD